MNTFNEMLLSSEIKQALDSLGFAKPTEIQKKVIPYLIENPNTDVHAQAQTGTGKTLGFGIPLLHLINPSQKMVQGLIVAPTRELVLQIYESLKEVARHTKIVIVPVYGGMPIERQISLIKQGAHIIVGTPGRLNDHLRRKTLSLNHLKVLVLDEADIMLDMGFREEIDEILGLAPNDRQIWLFSATVGAGIQQLMKSHMKNVFSIKASGQGVVTTQVKQYYCIVPSRKRIEAISRFIEAAPDFYGIIFCQTKLLTVEVTEHLIARGFRVQSLQGDMKQTLRNKVIKDFKDKKFNILVATDVAARGIDVSDLTHVINYSIPMETESYIHRIGRTGRAGKEGTAIVFVSANEMYKIRRLEKIAKTTLQEIPVPPIEAIINIKIGAVSDFIEQAKKKAGESPIYFALKKLIDSFSLEEVQNAFVATLEDKFFKDILHENLGSVDVNGPVPQEICIGLGQDDGFSEQNIRNYLYLTCKVLPQEVRKVRVLRDKTFISIPEHYLDSCMTAMRESPLTEKKHRIFLVEDYRRQDQSKKKRFEGRPQRDFRRNKKRSY